MSATLQFRATTSNLGGAATATQISSTPMNNLFDNVSPDEASAGSVEYRAFDVFNAGDATATVTAIYCNGTPSEKSDVLFALEASPLNSTTSIASETTAPSVSGSFTVYTSASKLSIPDISSGSYCRVWVKRVITAGATNTASDGSTLTVEYA